MLSTKNFLEDCILEWGIPASKINEAYTQAIYEAKHFNKHKDIKYLKETMSIILDRQDKNFLEHFMKCGHYDLKEFIDSLYDDKITETIESTDFASNQKPEKSGHKFYTNGMEDVLIDDNQEENNKEADK